MSSREHGRKGPGTRRVYLTWRAPLPRGAAVKALMSALSPDADLICRRGIRETIVDGVNKLLIDDLSKGAEYTKAFVEALGDVRPVSTLLGSPELSRISPASRVRTSARSSCGAAPRR